MSIKRRDMLIVSSMLLAMGIPETEVKAGTDAEHVPSPEPFVPHCDPSCPCCHTVEIFYIYEGATLDNLADVTNDPVCQRWPLALAKDYVQASANGQLGWHWWDKATGLHGPYDGPSQCWNASPLGKAPPTEDQQLTDLEAGYALVAASSEWHELTRSDYHAVVKLLNDVQNLIFEPDEQFHPLVRATLPQPVFHALKSIGHLLDEISWWGVNGMIASDGATSDLFDLAVKSS